jgi:hypothetical protein
MIITPTRIHKVTTIALDAARSSQNVRLVSQFKDSRSQLEEQQNTASEEVRHIYRSLLRATSYIPDQFARTYMHNHIVKRFQKSSSKHLDLKHTKQRINRARRAIRILEGASNGGIDDLKRVLEQAYGRKGPRKRVLLEELIRKDESNLPKDDSALEELINKPSSRAATDYEPGTKFFQFLRSQQANQPLEAHSNSVKKLQPTIPKTNIWMRPLPKKAEKGIRQKWWAMTLDKLYPPVPSAEWERLKGFATGTLPIEDPPVRRAAPSSKGTKPEWTCETEDVLDFLKSRPKIDGLDAELVKFDHERGICVVKGAAEKELRRSYPTPSQRALRRLYASIWNATPTMHQDEVTGTWVIRWGGQKGPSANGEITKPSKAQKEFFEGLEEMRAKPPKKGRGGVKDRVKDKIAKGNQESGTVNPLLKS